MNELRDLSKVNRTRYSFGLIRYSQNHIEVTADIINDIGKVI